MKFYLPFSLHNVTDYMLILIKRVFLFINFFRVLGSELFACRRNNKTEKRKRNRDYARKFQSKVSFFINNLYYFPAQPFNNHFALTSYKYK